MAVDKGFYEQAIMYRSALGGTLLMEKMQATNANFRSLGTLVDTAEARLSQATMNGSFGVALLTGGFDKPYVFGLATELASKKVCLDIVGSNDVDGPEMHTAPELKFLNLWGPRGEAHPFSKVIRILTYYGRLLRYAASAKPRIFHILWNNKFQYFDRTLLMLYYKLLGKRVVLTAHNVNAGERDANDSAMNRVTLRAQYLLADHIFVHTARMKEELIQTFDVQKEKVSVIPFGINNSVPHTGLSSTDAKLQLGLTREEKAILFFGSLRPYKGLEYLVDAFLRLAERRAEYRLIIAGGPRKGSEIYLKRVMRRIEDDANQERIIRKIRYISDEETELYFMAADVLALPYTHVFQSGVLFLAYSFGLPVVATDVGSIKEDIIEGETGFLCRSCDSLDLVSAIETYFESDLFRRLNRRREEIKEWANARNSWSIVGEATCKVYAELLKQ